MPRFSFILMDHFRSPRNAGRITAPDAVGRGSLDGRAPRLTLYLQVDGRRVRKATFHAFGCGATIAAGSMLTEMVTGREIQECLDVSSESLVQALGGLPGDKRFCADVAIAALTDALGQLSQDSAAPHPDSHRGSLVRLKPPG